MNERIQQLSDIAYKNHLARNPHSSFGRRLDYEREFAELIVRECASIASGTAVENPPNDLFYGYNLGVNKTAEKIREHFGVEE